MAKSRVLQNTEKKHFSWGLFFLKSEILGCRTTTLEKENSFANTFFGIFENLEHSFLSDLFKKSICSGVFSSAVGCGIYSINCIKKKLYYIIFSGYFPKFSV